MADSPSDATRVLAAHTGGDPGATSQLLPLVYAQLRDLARHYMRGERPDHTLQPTALVNEAYLRLIDIRKVDWQGRTHFVAMAATQMRRILVDYGRAHRAEKRGKDRGRVTLDESLRIAVKQPLDPLVLDNALETLARESQRASRVAELRCLAGLETKEIAYVLDVSERTVKRDWRLARAWLKRELAGSRGVA